MPFESGAQTLLTTFLLVAGVITLAAFTQRLLGFGFALVSLSGLPLILDIRVVNLVASFAVLAPLTVMYYRFRSHIDRRLLVAALLGGAVGLPLGVAFFLYADADILKKVTGAAILLILAEMVLFRRAKEKKEKAASQWQGGVAGLVSGILCGAVGVPGPPVVVYAAKQPWSPDEFRSFTVGFFIWLAFAKVIVVTACGCVDWEVGTWSLVAAPFTMVGYRLGAAAAQRVSPSRFRPLVLGVLVIGAARMVV